MTTEAERIPKGTLVDGRYEIRDHLGEGGMGTVYRARDTKMGQPVALKVLLQGGKGDRSREERRRRFMNEIYAINEVAHRNVVQVLEFGFFKDTPFMVMELLKGKDLSRVMHDSPGLLPVDYCVDVILVVCAAIQACHHKGIIHRDLKPGNVMVIETDSGPGWDVKVLDFSISSISKVAADLTRDGQILGTPRFLSPEQVNGKILPASDQYAIGLLLYVCLTKRHPFADLDGLPLIRAIERGRIPGPRSLRPDIPEALEQVIMKAISVDPAQRFDKVQDLGRALWPFGSQLGQGVWKKYYFETPPEGAPRSNEAKMLTTGIPLLLQMAKGDVPLNSATVVAHYQSTTSVQATSTIDDPEARARAEADGSRRSVSGQTSDDPQARPAKSDGPSAPSAWSWQSSSGGASRDAEAGQGSRKPRSKMLVAGLALGAAIAVGAVAVGMSRTGRQTAEAPRPAAAELRLQPQPLPAMPAPPAPTAEAAIAPIDTKSATREVVREVENRSPATVARPQRKHKKRPADQAVQYTSEGVPLLPSD